jgi:hypothetical protein
MILNEKGDCKKTKTTEILKKFVMIIISNGLQKSGSSLAYIYSMFFAQGHFGAYARFAEEAVAGALESGRLKGIKKRFIHHIGEEELTILSEIADQAGPVLVKTHTPINPALAKALENGRVRMTYTHRDPRDMILSAINHCEKTRDSGLPDMQNFTSIRNSMEPVSDDRPFMKMKPVQQHLLEACDWLESGLTHPIAYHDLLTDPGEVIAGIMNLLGIPRHERMIEHVIKREIEIRKPGIWQYNRGQLNRFREEMNKSDLEFCNRELGDFITRMGYEL